MRRFNEAINVSFYDLCRLRIPVLWQFQLSFERNATRRNFRRGNYAFKKNSSVFNVTRGLTIFICHVENIHPLFPSSLFARWCHETAAEKAKAQHTKKRPQSGTIYVHEIKIFSCSINLFCSEEKCFPCNLCFEASHFHTKHCSIEAAEIAFPLESWWENVLIT